MLLEDNEHILKETEEKIKDGEKLLERAQEQQIVTAELLSDVDGANAKAEEAVNRGALTLKEAQETFKKLSGNYFNIIYIKI